MAPSLGNPHSSPDTVVWHPNPCRLRFHLLEPKAALVLRSCLLQFLDCFLLLTVREGSSFPSEFEPLQLKAVS